MSVPDEWFWGTLPERVPAKIDPSVAHSARIYDYLLGGRDNFAADREAAEQMTQALPNVRPASRMNRDFLARAVRYLVTECGIRQFIDIGTGIPSADNTHEVAQAIAPQARVVYVDNDRCKSGCAHTYGAVDIVQSATTSFATSPAFLLQTRVSSLALSVPPRPVIT